MSQESVREKVKNIIENKGVTQTFFCRKTGIPAPVMSLFIRGKKELWEFDLEKLDICSNEIMGNMQ